MSHPNTEELSIITRTKGLLTHNEIYDWLTHEFELEHGHATNITRVILANHSTGLFTKEVQAIFTGKLADWKPITEEFLSKLRHFGPDVSTKVIDRDIVLLRSKQLFSVLKVQSGQLDIGILLEGAAFSDTYQEAGAWESRVTHRVQVIVGQQIDDELISWLRQAYEQAGL